MAICNCKKWSSHISVITFFCYFLMEIINMTTYFFNIVIAL